MSDQPTDLVESGSDLREVETVLLEREAEEHGFGMHPHPGPRQYVIIAVVLVIVTALEVGCYYLEGDVGDNLLIFILLAMGAAKFLLVASYYMHMKVDPPFFRRLFTVGLVGAFVVYGVALLTFVSTVLAT